MRLSGQILIFFLFVTSVIASDWRLVEQFDNTPTYIYTDVKSITCPDSNNCFAIVDNPSTPVLYKSTDQGRNWILIYEDDKKNKSFC